MSFRFLGLILSSESGVNAFLELVVSGEYNLGIILLDVFFVLCIVVKERLKPLLSSALKERGYKVNLYAVPLKLIRVHFKVEVVVLKERTDL